MKVKVDGKPTQEEVDLEFPRYGEAQYGDYHTSDHYWRVTEKNGRLSRVQICINGRTIEIEVVEDEAMPSPRNAAYVLGLGEYESTEQAFNKALAKAKSHVLGLEPL